MAPARYSPRSTDLIVEMPASRSEPNSRRKSLMTVVPNLAVLSRSPEPARRRLMSRLRFSRVGHNARCSCLHSRNFYALACRKRRSVSSRRQSSVPGCITVAAPAATPKRTASRNVSPRERARPIPPTIESPAPTRLSIFTSGESKHSQPSAEAATRRVRLITKQRRLRTC